MFTSYIKGVILIVFLSLSGILGYGQELDSLARTTIVDAKPMSLEEASSKMINSIVQKDYNTYMEMTYPRLIEIFGGKEMMLSSTKSNKEAQETAGMILQSAQMVDISEVLEKNGEFQAIVSFDYILEISGNNYKGEQYLLAIADKEDLNWTFVELETFDEPSIKEFLPNYNDDLIYPTIKGAEYIEK